MTTTTTTSTTGTATAVGTPRRDIRSSIWFLEESPLYKSEKPYTINFQPEDPNCPKTNIVAKEAPNVLVHDIRPRLHSLSFDKNGFTVSKIARRPTMAEVEDEALRRKYFASLEQALKKDFGTEHVEIIGHLIRKRDPMFPVATGEEYKNNQPIRMAHVDWTPRSVKEKIATALGVRGPEVLEKSSRFILASVWKPLNGTGRDWPLAVCNASTVKPEEDLEPSDIVQVYKQEETFQVYERQRHEWYYLSEQTAEEVLVFRTYDSMYDAMRGIPHAAIHDPDAAVDEIPRESIESHALIWWD